MKCSVMVMSREGGAVKCETTGMLALEPLGGPPVGAEESWGAPEACAEGAEGCPVGAEGATDCAVEPVGAGVNLTVADIEEI